MRRTTALPAVTLAAAAVALALLAGCTNGTPTTIGAPTAGTSAAAPAPATGTNSAAPVPAAGTNSVAPAAGGTRPAGNPGPSRSGPRAIGRPSLPSPDSWSWTLDAVRLPDGATAVVNVPSGWAVTTRVRDGRSQQDRRSPDGSLLLRIEYGRTNDEPSRAVQRAATDPYASWPGYARSATVPPMQLKNAPVSAGGAEFTFREASGSRQARVTTYARPGWVLAIYSSGPDLTGVRTGGWELAQKAGDVRFAS